MNPFLFVAVGFGLTVFSYLVGRFYHMWWLGDKEWNGLPGSVGGDRIATWIDNLGLLLIVVGIADGLLRWLLHWS